MGLQTTGTFSGLLWNRVTVNIDFIADATASSNDVADDIPVTLGFGIPPPPPSYKDAVAKKNASTFVVS